MKDNSIKDIKNLYFSSLGDKKIVVCFDNCSPYTSNLISVLFIYTLLDKYKSNVIDTFYKEEYEVFGIEKDVATNLITKFEQHYNDILDKARYINKASNDMKEDRGWSQEDLAVVGYATGTIELTVREIVNLHNVLEYFERHYDDFNKGLIHSDIISYAVSPAMYYQHLGDIKNMLEKRLGEMVISGYRYCKYKHEENKDN